MIRINLLPQGVPGAVQRIAIPWRALGIGAGSLLFVLSAWLCAANQIQAHALERLRAELQRLEPQRLKWDQTRASLAALQNRAHVLQMIKAPEAQWAPRLNLLSDALVSQLWFTQLKYGVPAAQGQDASGVPANPSVPPGALPPSAGASEPVLLLSGSALVATQEAGSPVSRYLQKLKEQPDFSRWFRGLDLKAVEHRQAGQEEVSDFIVALYPVGS